MRELFTRGLRGSRSERDIFRACSGDWHLVPIEALGKVVAGTTPPTMDSANYLDGNIPFVTPGDFEHSHPISSTARTLTRRALSLSRAIPAGPTCVVCIGSTIGKVGHATAEVCATASHADQRRSFHRPTSIRAMSFTFSAGGQRTSAGRHPPAQFLFSRKGHSSRFAYSLRSNIESSKRLPLSSMASTTGRRFTGARAPSSSTSSLYCSTN